MSRVEIIDADVHGYSMLSGDLRYMQDHLCRELGGLIFVSQGNFFYQWRDERGNWHTLDLDTTIFDERLAQRNGDCKLADFLGLAVLDIESEALDEALAGDPVAIIEFQQCSLKMMQTWPNASHAIYGPRLPHVSHPDFTNKVVQWSKFMEVMEAFYDEHKHNVIWLPPLNNLNEEDDTPRFKAVIELAKTFGGEVYPYIYAPRHRTMRQYAQAVTKAVRGKDLDYLLAWDQALVP